MQPNTIHYACDISASGGEKKDASSRSRVRHRGRPFCTRRCAAGMTLDEDLVAPSSPPPEADASCFSFLSCTPFGQSLRLFAKRLSAANTARVPNSFAGAARMAAGSSPPHH